MKNITLVVKIINKLLCTEIEEDNVDSLARTLRSLAQQDEHSDRIVFMRGWNRDIRSKVNTLTWIGNVIICCSFGVGEGWALISLSPLDDIDGANSFFTARVIDDELHHSFDWRLGARHPQLVEAYADYLYFAFKDDFPHSGMSLRHIEEPFADEAPMELRLEAPAA